MSEQEHQQQDANDDQQQRAPTQQELAAYAKEHGNLAFKQGDFKRAITLYSGAVHNEPTNFIHYSNRCAAYMKVEQYTQAQQDIEKCLSLKDDFEKGYFRLAKILVQKQKWTAAFQTLKTGIEKCKEISKEFKELQQQVETKLKEQVQQDALKRQRMNIIDRVKTLSGQARFDLECKLLYHENKAREMCQNTNTTYDALERKIYAITKPPSQSNDDKKVQYEMTIILDWKPVIESTEKSLAEDDIIKQAVKDVGKAKLFLIVALVCFKYGRVELSEHFAKLSLQLNDSTLAWIVLGLSVINQDGYTVKVLSCVKKALAISAGDAYAVAFFVEVMDALPQASDVGALKTAMQDVLLAMENSSYEGWVVEQCSRYWFMLAQATFGANQQLAEIINHSASSLESCNLVKKIFNSSISVTQPLASLCFDNFFISLLRLAILPRSDMEELFIHIRASALLVFTEGDIVPPLRTLLVAVAVQAMLCGFAWHISDMEQKRLTEKVSELEAKLLEHQGKIKWSISQELQDLITIVALYAPLFKLNNFETLKQINKKDVSFTFAQLVKQNRYHQVESQHGIKIVGEVLHQSKCLAHPQWMSTSPVLCQVPLQKEIEWHFPYTITKNFDNQKSHSVLVLQSGTGLVAAQLCSSYENVHVVAVDASLAKLCYAKKQYEVHGINGVDLVCCNPLLVSLATLGRTSLFDALYVEQYSSTLLLKQVVPLVREGAFLRFTLCSQTFVDGAKYAKKLLQQNPMFNQATPEALQQARHALQQNDDYQLRPLKSRAEFHVLQSLEQLLFEEPQVFTLAEAYSLLQELNLKLVAISNLPAAFVKEYKEKYSADPHVKDLKVLSKFAEGKAELLKSCTAFTLTCEKQLSAANSPAQQNDQKKDPLLASAFLRKFT